MDVSVHKSNNGKWYFRKRITLPNGTVKHIQRTFKTKKEAQLQEQLFKISNDEIASLTFYDVYLHYLEYQKTKVQPSTIYNTERLMEVHVLPYFKNKKISKINSIELMEWQKEINSKDYSIKYKKDMFTYLSSVFKYAVKHFDLDKNPMTKLDNFHDIKAKVSRIDFFTLDEYLKFISVVDDPVYKLFFELLFYSGCRRGEILALTWQDVNWITNEISITKTVKSARGTGSQYIGYPKTGNGVRNIILPDDVLNELKEQYILDKQLDGFNDEFYVCGGIDFLKNSTIERRKNNFCKLAKVKQIRIHDFRHSHAALLINQGISMYILSKRLGHAKIEITANIYGHLYPSVQEQIKDTLNNLKKVKI